MISEGRFKIDLTASASTCRFSVAIMMDTEGSEVHTSQLDQPMKAEVWSVLQYGSNDKMPVPVATTSAPLVSPLK